jgi:hypothetical protein
MAVALPIFAAAQLHFRGRAPPCYGDAASLAMERGRVACMPESAVVKGSVVSIDTAPAPYAQFGTPRTLFNPRPLPISAKFTFEEHL